MASKMICFPFAPEPMQDNSSNFPQCDHTNGGVSLHQRAKTNDEQVLLIDFLLFGSRPRPRDFLTLPS